MRSGEELIQVASQRLDQVIESINPKVVITLFSGGHDSLVASHIAAQHPSLDFVCHLDTGIGVAATRSFVRNTCSEWGVELVIARAVDYVRGDGKPDPQVYEDLVLEYGFPGPAMHRKMYNRLKERPLRQTIRNLKLDRGEKVMLVSGVRKNESQRRMRHVEEVQAQGRVVWVAPIWDFDKVEVGTYIEFAGLRRNEVVDMLHKSGECLCGAFAKKGELAELRFWLPDVATEIERIQEKVMKQFPWGWEEKPPRWWQETKKGQTILPGFESLLCRSCRP